MTVVSRRCAAWAVVLGILGVPCKAADPGSTTSVGVNAAAPFGLPIDDNGIFLHASLDQLEDQFDAHEDGFRWEGEAWCGSDANRLWLKSEGYAGSGAIRDGQQEALYDRPISTFFDLQTGARYDLDSKSGRGWGAVGVEGLAPHNFKVSATGYASDAGHFAARISASYELLLTQKLILEPQFELNGYTRSDRSMQVGAGFSQFDGGLRLRYEIRRKFAPYFGGSFMRSSYAIDSPRNLWRLTAGIRIWY